MQGRCALALLRCSDDANGEVSGPPCLHDQVPRSKEGEVWYGEKGCRKPPWGGKSCHGATKTLEGRVEAEPVAEGKVGVLARSYVVPMMLNLR